MGAYKKVRIKKILHPLEAWWEGEALLKSGRFQKKDILGFTQRRNYLMTKI